MLLFLELISGLVALEHHIADSASDERDLRLAGEDRLTPRLQLERAARLSVFERVDAQDLLGFRTHALLVAPDGELLRIACTVGDVPSAFVLAGVPCRERKHVIRLEIEKDLIMRRAEEAFDAEPLLARIFRARLDDVGHDAVLDDLDVPNDRIVVLDVLGE